MSKLNPLAGYRIKGARPYIHIKVPGPTPFFVQCRWMLLVVAAGCIISCSKPATKAVFPVDGEVFIGSTPAEGARIVLMPQGESALEGWTEGYPRAIVGADGTFIISTFSPEDGAPPGEYIVTVTWPEPAAANSDTQGESSPTDRLGGRYSDPESSQLRAKIETQATKLPRFELKR